MLKIRQFAFNDFGVNTFVVYDTDTLDAMIVDPGMSGAAERAHLDRFIADNGLVVRQLVNTHLHMDHCLGDNYVRDRYGVKVQAHAGDAFLGESVRQQAMSFGVNAGDDVDVTIDVPLSDGDTVQVGHYSFTVLHVPGHSPGGIALYCKDANVLIAGDILFSGSIGRTDLPGGNYRQLTDGIRSKLFVLPGETQVLPGHGGPTTIGAEKSSNPFFR